MWRFIISALAKTRRTEENIEIVIRHGRGQRRFAVSKDTAKGILYLIRDHEVVADEVISWRTSSHELIARYSEAGVVLRGARAKAELSQQELANRLGIPQGQISEMENGKRTIGKKMAKRLSKVLDIDYRVFL